MKIKKAWVVVSAGLLCFPTLSFPVISTSMSVSAIENSVELSRESELMDSLTSTTETKVPVFSFEENQEPFIANKQFQLVVRSSQDISEFVLNLPEGVSIVEDKQSADSKFTNIEGSQWQVQTNSPQMIFAIPLVVEKAGEYEIAVGESKMTLNIQAEESQQTSEQEVTSSEEKETAKTEESTVEEEASVSSDKKSSTIDTLQNDSEQVTESVRSTKEASVQDVANWEEFIRAFVDPSITTINVVSDFKTPDNPRLNLTDVTTGGTSNPNGGTAFVYLNVANISRNLTVEGNGHQIDFRAITLCFNNITANSSTPWNITLKDLEIYHGNYYGPLTFNDLNQTNQTASEITYHNITNYGNQLIHSPYASIKFSGKSSSKQVSEYTSSFNTWRINSVNQTNIYASNLTILEDAEVELETIGAGNLDLGGVVHPNNNFRMEKNSSLNAVSKGSGGEADGTSLLVRRGSVEIDEGAKMNLVPQNSRSAISLRTSNSSLRIKENSKLTIDSKGTKSNANGYLYNIIWMAAGSNLLVENGSTLNIVATEMGASPSNIVHVNGNATVSIGKDATLNIKSDSTSNSQNLMYFDSENSIFEFSDAQEVNLERTATITGTSTANGLINIAGSQGLLNINVQSVKQWNRGNFETNPDYSWTPIYNLNLKYKGVVSSIENVSSVLQETLDSFKQYFTTQNVQRVLFEKIPNVEVTIDPLTEDPNEMNSHTITGTANPNSVIRFSGDPAIPAGSIASPDVNENEKYHVMADEEGNYCYELPEGQYFTAGNTVTAYAFLNGQSATASTIVQETQKQEIEVPSMQNGPFAIAYAPNFDFGTQLITTEDRSYKAKALKFNIINSDETVERPHFAQVRNLTGDDSIGWQLKVFQSKDFYNGDSMLEGAQIELNGNRTSNSSNLGVIGNDVTISKNSSIVLSATSETAFGLSSVTWGTEGNLEGNTGEKVNPNVQLKVPGSSAKTTGNYEAELTWVLESVPSN
ncbi:WxL domain-containing protein [Enterococcus hirae]|uniref:WxL domain-containing protein n=1 Tax=Enterococcus hirae TaxID=1354 RepID=UPI001A979647|nr:WxL domain-containing protein [Enterococcus hirae]